MWLERLRSDESGVALVTALLAIFALLSLSVLFVALTHTENRVTGKAKAFEAALHVAEGATDQVIAKINRDEDGTHHTDHEYTCDGAADRESCEETWLLGIMADDTERAKAEEIVADVGEGFAVRPFRFETIGGVSTKVPMDVLFGVGFAPDRADPLRTRIVRLQFDQRTYNPQHAVLTCGDFELGGNASITDISGNNSADVHSNGNISVGGNSVNVEGTVRATGNVSGTLNSGETQSGAIEEDCPPINARDFYTRRNTSGFDWRDLCPDGTVRERDPGGQPCAGTVIVNVLSTGPWDNWSFSDSNRVWSTSAVQDGVFYVYQGTVKLSGIDKSGGASSRTVTIIAEADPASTGGTSGSSCKSGNVNTGNICLSGSPSLDAALEQTLLIADRDVDLIGNPSAGPELTGFVFAREQLEASGTVTLRGAMIAADETDTARSPVHKSLLSGTLNLEFDPNLEIPITGLVRITAWNELEG